MISWRAAFIVPGALCGAIGVALLCFVRSGNVIAAPGRSRGKPAAAAAPANPNRG